MICKVDHEFVVKKFVLKMAAHTYHMFNPTVLSLCVFPDCDQINISVGRLIAFNGHARTHIGIQVKGFSQQQVHGRVPGSNWCFQGSCGVKYR